jgi:predicted amidohydrolase YtcJ
LIPPFHDSHVHLFLSGSENYKQREKELSYSFNESVKNGKNNLKKLMRYGIFSVIDAGDSKWSALSLRDSNEFKGFELRVAGKALFKKSRYGSFIGLEITDKKSLKNALNELLEKKVDVIKVLNSGINSVKEYAKETEPQFSFSELKYIVDFARDNNLDVIVHVNGKKAIKETIRHNVYRLEHAFFIGEENIGAITDKGIKISPTFSAMYNLIRNPFLNKQEIDIIKKTVDNHINEINFFLNSGGKVELGTDSGSFNVKHGEAFFKEIEFFMEKLKFSFDDILSICCKKELNSPFLIHIDSFSYESLKKLKVEKF